MAQISLSCNHCTWQDVATGGKSAAHLVVQHQSDNRGHYVEVRG